jgi:hypothetical protein
MSVILSLGAPVYSDDEQPEQPEQPELPDGASDSYDESSNTGSASGVTLVPVRDEVVTWNGMRRVAESSTLELRILEEFAYTGTVTDTVELVAHDDRGRAYVFEDGMFEANDNNVDIHDDRGTFVKTEFLGNLQRKPDDGGVMRVFYSGVVTHEVPKIKEEGIFAVRNKANGFIWWSNPINATHDPIAGSRDAQLNNLSSPLYYRRGNPAEPGATTTVHSNVFQEGEFTNNLVSIDEISNGVRFNYLFLRRDSRTREEISRIEVSMEIALDGDSVLVTIPEERLRESDISSDNGGVMLALNLLSSFGAAPRGEDGYIIVPDGSGAVIEFDNNKVSAFTYEGQVYGRDYARSQQMAAPVIQQVYLPVFGIVRDGGSNALVAVAEKGAENAVIRAAVPGQRENATSLNVVWFEFNMRTEDSFYIGSEFTAIPIFEAGHITTGDLAVRYFPLAASSGAELSYVDVANRYRDYLVATHGMTPKTSPAAPFYMTVGGGTVKTHSIMGFPVDLQTAATTYSQAQSMAERLAQGGVNNAVITFNDFNTAQIRRRVSNEIKYASLLGGKSDFTRLNNALPSGYSLYPSLSFTEYYNSGGGYSFMSSSSREATRSRAILQHHELAFGTPDPLADTRTILSPHFFPESFNKALRSMQKEGIRHITLDRATALLYSDFTTSRSRTGPNGTVGFNRRDTMQVLTEGFAKLDSAGISILAQSANAYALPYVDHISNVPLFSSNYDVFDYDIPFYQIVIHGLIPYTTRPFNQAADLDRLTLLALSTGTPIHYEFIYTNPGEFSDSAYNKKFYASFHAWADDAVAQYNTFNSIIGDVVNQRIVRHTRLSATETETQFEGGKVVYVDFDSGEVRVNGNPVSVGR